MFQGWEAGHAQDSSLKAGPGYNKSHGSDPQAISSAALCSLRHGVAAQAALAILPNSYQSAPGLARVSLQGFGVPRATFALEPRRLSGPIQFLLKLLDSWRLTRENAVVLLGFDESDNDYARAVLEGKATLHGRDVRDRIALLFQIRKTLSTLLRDLDVENEWLREPHVLLEGREPLDLLLGGSMENLLLVKEYVDAAAGR